MGEAVLGVEEIHWLVLLDLGELLWLRGWIESTVPPFFNPVLLFYSCMYAVYVGHCIHDILFKSFFLSLGSTFRRRLVFRAVFGSDNVQVKLCAVHRFQGCWYSHVTNLNQ